MSAAAEELSTHTNDRRRAVREAPSLRSTARKLRAKSVELRMKNARVIQKADAVAQSNAELCIRLVEATKNRRA